MPGVNFNPGISPMCGNDEQCDTVATGLGWLAGHWDDAAARRVARAERLSRSELLGVAVLLAADGDRGRAALNRVREREGVDGAADQHRLVRLLVEETRMSAERTV